MVTDSGAVGVRVGTWQHWRQYKGEFYPLLSSCIRKKPATLLKAPNYYLGISTDIMDFSEVVGWKMYKRTLNEWEQLPGSAQSAPQQLMQVISRVIFEGLKSQEIG